jgi:toxin secretion/phage lysis holin
MTSMNEFFLITKGVFTGIQEFFTLKLFPTVFVPLYGMLFGFETKNILQALLILVIIDFITGILSAYAAKEQIKSKNAVRSAFKISVYGLLIAAGHLTEQVTPGGTYIEEAVTTFLALTELISIIENIGKMGFAIPQKLLNKLHKFRDEDVTMKAKKTVKVTTNPKTDAVTTHTVEEKVVETHTVETPKPKP